MHVTDDHARDLMAMSDERKWKLIKGDGQRRITLPPEYFADQLARHLDPDMRSKKLQRKKLKVPAPAVFFSSILARDKADEEAGGGGEATRCAPLTPCPCRTWSRRSRCCRCSRWRCAPTRPRGPRSLSTRRTRATSCSWSLCWSVEGDVGPRLATPLPPPHDATTRTPYPLFFFLPSSFVHPGPAQGGARQGGEPAAGA